MTLRILEEAHNDAAEAAQRYEGLRSGLGAAFLAELTTAYQKIEQHPRGQPLVEHPEIEGDVRRLLLKRFPYLLVYEMVENAALVLAVAHASRDPRFWTDRMR